MRIRYRLLTGFGLPVVALLSGCNQQPPIAQGEEQGPANAAMVHRFMDEAERNAAVAERAVYPYHFVPNEAMLNDLGEKHVQLLAEAYRSAPGELTIVQGDVSPQLLRARTKAVLDWLATAGVDTARVTVDAQLPSGPGISSARAAKALEDRSRQQTQTADAPLQTSQQPKPESR